MSKKNTGKAPALRLTRWRYFCKTLYSNAATKGEFSYEGVTYLKDEELRAIEEKSTRVHVEAHVVAVERLAQHTADDVFAGVLLHMVKAALPVQRTVNGFAWGKGRVADVRDNAVFFPHVADGGTAQRTVVGGLPATFGVKSGLIQHNGKAALTGLTVGDCGVKFPEKRVVVVEFNGFHEHIFLS